MDSFAAEAFADNLADSLVALGMEVFVGVHSDSLVELQGLSVAE